MRAVFLDRDNTLIDNDGDLGDPERVVLRNGVADALHALHDAGYRLIVVTNQGGVARGAFTEQDVDAVHQRIAELVDQQAGARGIIDRFYYCPYHPEGTVAEYQREHPWRKPQPGMLIQAARDLELDLDRCWMVGDQTRDVQAGTAAGCRTILVGDREDADGTEGEVTPMFRVQNLQEAVEVVLREDADRYRRVGGARPADRHRKGAVGGELEPLRRALHDLAEEIRSERLRRTDFTMLRMAAGICQLLVLLFALLALLQAGQFEPFMKWMAAAFLVQLVTVTFVLLDLRS